LRPERPRAAPAGAPSARGDRIAAWEPFALAGVLVLALALRLALLGALPLWFDEAFSLDVARRTLPQIWAFLPGHDPHPVGYYALLSVWIHVSGTSLASIRLPSLLFGLAAVVLTWRLGRELFSPLIGVVAAGLAAVNPFEILASDDARMYAMLACLGLAATWTLWRASRAGAGTGWWVAYGGAVALLAYTSYYALLLIFAHAMWVVTSRPRRAAAAQLGIAAAVALALYVPWLLASPTVSAWPSWRQPITANDVADLIAMPMFGGYVFGFGTYHYSGAAPPPVQALLLVPWIALGAAGAVVLGRVNRTARSLVGLAWLVPLVVVVAASLAFGGRAAFPRHLVFLQPFAALVIAAGIVHLREAVGAPRGAAVSVLGVVLAATFVVPALGSAETNLQVRAYRYDLAARYLKDLYRPGDIVLFFPGQVFLPFRYYFVPPDRIELVVYQHGWTDAALRAPIRQIAAMLAARRVRRVWLVFSPPWPRGALESLQQALVAAGYARAPAADFNELWVTLFMRPSP